MKKVRDLLWFNGWLVFAFLFIAGLIYFGYGYIAGDPLLKGPDQRLSSLVAEVTDPTQLRALFLSHLQTEQEIARAQSSLADSVVWLAVLVSACGAFVALVNFLVLRRIRAMRDDEL